MKFTRIVSGLFAAALLSGWAGGSAKAAITLVENSATQASDWTYTYAVTLTSGSQINSGTATSSGTVPTAGGDFFKLVDFNGYVASSFNVAGLSTLNGGQWQVVVGNLGLTPTDLAAVGVDSSSIPNVNFQYVGTGNGASNNQSLIGPLSLGTFTIHSTIGPGAVANVTYQSQCETIPSPPTDQSNQGVVIGPVPEAASLGLLAVGALGLLVRRRR